MMRQYAEVAMPAQQLLHHLTSRRHRVYGAIGVALTLLAAAFWIYGGFATDIDFSTSSPRPPDLAVPSSPKATTPVSSSPELAVPPPAANFPVSPSPSPPPSPSPASPPPPVSPTPDLPSPSTTAASNTTDGQGTNQHSAAADDAAAHPAQPTPGAAASVDTSQGIPPKIWQIVLPKKPSSDTTKINPQSLEDTPSWLAMNPDYRYTLVGQKGGEALVDKYFGSEPGIVEAYAKMPNVGMKSDLLRYLILSAEGGVYTDTDTIALRPVDAWIPEKFRGKVAVIVGIEFDKRDGVSWVDINHAVQFCQWTIAAVPGHKLFRAMVERVLLSLKDLSAEHGAPIQELKPTSFEVMNSTGPAAFTDVVFAQLQEHGVTKIEDLSYMTEPRLYGDILVLTIDGFGMGQAHSHSTNDGTIPEAALVRHLFKGGWRGDKRKRVPAV